MVEVPPLRAPIAEPDASLRARAGMRPAPARPRGRSQRWLRYVLFGSIFSIAGSAFSSMRMDLGGMQVHPFMVPAAILFVTVALPNLGVLPTRIRLTAVLFFVVYVLAMLQGGDGLASEAVKVGSFLAVMAAIAVAVARSGAHEAVVVALNVAVVVMSVKGLSAGPHGLEGVNPLDMANKNAFSLYALPALLIGGHYVLEPNRSARWVRFGLLACMLVTLLAVFSSANRSGWLGAVLIATMLFIRGRSLRTTLLVLALAIAAYMLVVNFSGTDVIEYRIDLTKRGYSSDQKRSELLTESLEIGLENPLLGISPLRLPYELARRIRFESDVIDPHNVLALLVGGTGFLGTAALMALGASLWMRRSTRRADALSPAARSAHALLRMGILLWILRGMFSREVLYSPSFAVALGLALGLSIRGEVWRPRPRTPLKRTPPNRTLRAPA
jgi:O-antigen ligase